MERLTGKQAQNMMEALASVYDVINEMDERSPEANAAKQEAAKLAAQKRRESQNVKQDASATKAQQTADSVPTKKSDRPAVTAGGGVPSQSGQVDRYRQMARERARKNSMGMESADLFDIVKGHLVSEGLSEEDALKKMLEMTEEEKAEIVEGAPYVVTNADMKGNTKAYQNFKAGMKNKLTGKPLYVAAPHLKGV